MTELNEIKAKYPLAVEALSHLGNNLHYDVGSGCVMTESGIVAEVLEVRGWGQIQQLTAPEARQDEIGKMLAELLNLIAKP